VEEDDYIVDVEEKEEEFVGEEAVDARDWVKTELLKSVCDFPIL
jgi:hypothetical protein